MVNQLNNESQDTKEAPKKKRKTPPTPRSKVLKMSDVDKKIKKLNELSTYTIDTKTGEAVKYYEVFDEKKIQELLAELNDHMQYDKEHTIGYFESDQKVIEYLNFLVIKHFSHFRDEIGTQFETNLAAFDKLVSLGLFHKFHTDIFNPEQIAKVFERFYERIELATKVIELPEETKQQLANMQNKDIIFNAFKNKQIPEV